MFGSKRSCKWVKRTCGYISSRCEMTKKPEDILLTQLRKDLSNVLKAVDRLIEKEKELQVAIKQVQEQQARQQEIRMMKEEISKKDQEILNLESQLKEAEKILVSNELKHALVEFKNVICSWCFINFWSCSFQYSLLIPILIPTLFYYIILFQYWRCWGFIKTQFCNLDYQFFVFEFLLYHLSC